MTEKHKIVRLENQGGDIGVRGVLFIDWDDGVSTAIDSNKWTWPDFRALEMARQHGTPIERVGFVLGEPVTEAEFNADMEAGFASNDEPQITLGCTSQAQASRVANWYKMWMA